MTLAPIIELQLIWRELQIMVTVAQVFKGQLISEGNFGVFKSPIKMNMNQWQISMLISDHESLIIKVLLFY